MPPAPPLLFRLGDRLVDCTRRALIVGVLEPTPDHDARRRAAEALVHQGADVVEVPALAVPHHTAQAIALLSAQLDVAVACGSAPPEVVEAALGAGAVAAVCSERSFTSDVAGVAAVHRASVILTDAGPDSGDGAPPIPCDRFVTDVVAQLLEQAREAESAGLAPDRIAIGPDLGAGSLVPAALALRVAASLVGHGHPLVISATATGARSTTLAAIAYGVAHGARIVRVRDVAATVSVCRTVEAIVQASEESS